MALTWDDLQEMPDDGYRRELVHGQLLTTPSPARKHQRVLGELYFLLRSACPEGWEILVAPSDWRLSADIVFQPDLLVIEKDDADGPFTGVPFLIVEVLSPSTADTDRTLKRLEYERAGVPTYWLVDPVEPSLTVLRLTGGVYEEAALARGHDAYQADAPFPVSVIPARLVG